MNKKKSVYTCQSCNALFVCLVYFHEHRKTHAIQEGRTIYSCTHCQVEHTSEHETHLHSISHKDEPPHSCHLCQAKLVGISQEETHGSRRSIGTVTEDHFLSIGIEKPVLDKPPLAVATTTTSTHSNSINNVVEDPADDQDDDEDDDDNEDEDDDEDEDEDEDNEEVEDEDESHEDEESHANRNSNNNNNNNNNNNTTIDPRNICKTNVTNIFYVHNVSNQPRSASRPSRPSRSTGKGKGNRKARLTSDGDIRRKFSCCHCGKSFKTKSHLQRHILTHTGERPYHCNRCDCRFNQSSSLRNHVIAIHTKEYPHSCNNCRKGFLMPAVLQKHLQSTECGKLTGQVVEGL